MSRRHSSFAGVVVALGLAACSVAGNPAPTGTSPDGLRLMVSYDCEGDCGELAVGLDGRFYLASHCEPVDVDDLGNLIAVPDPESPVPIPHSEARPIVGIEPTIAVALGPEAPTGCVAANGAWWAARELDHLDDESLTEQLRLHAPP